MNNTDERNDTAQVCLACGETYDNRKGNYGQCFTNAEDAKSKLDFCLCENCIEDAHRGGVVSKEVLDFEMLKAVDFNKLRQWACMARVLSFCERAIKSEADAIEFFEALSGCIVWHPDDDFENYLNTTTGEDTFVESTAVILNTRMKGAFDLLGEKVYDLALESAKKLQWPEEVVEHKMVKTARKPLRKPLAPLASQIKSLMGQQILQDVLNAMQTAEEMGGVEDTSEYVLLMQTIAAEARIRIENAQHNKSNG
jgi:hypothetical protein